MIKEIVKKAEQESYLYYDQNIEEIPKRTIRLKEKKIASKP